MARLPETANALLSFPASQEYMFGVHEGSEPRAGVQGRNIGEVPFDLAKHSPLAINTMSVWEQVLGVPHVPVNIPGRPLNANIVVHQPESVGGDEMFNIGENRRWLGRVVAESIAESMPGLTDRTWHYAIGKRAEELGDPEAEVMVTQGNPVEEAMLVAEICKAGLTFVISDFLHLPLHTHDTYSFPATVGVKVNAPIDLGLPESRLVMRAGHAAGEVDPSDAYDRSVTNAALARLNKYTVRNLEAKGIAVAPVLLNRYLPEGFNVGSTD